MEWRASQCMASSISTWLERLTLANENVDRVIILATALVGGNRLKAWTWFRSTPLPEFGGKTAETLVQEGRVQEVISLLEMYEAGPAG